MFKYLFFLTVPLVGAYSILSENLSSYALLIYAFVMVPFTELLLSPDRSNADSQLAEKLKDSRVFDYIIYSVVPIFIVLLWLFLDTASQVSLNWGQIIAFGLVCGIMAINVGHELGHRHNRFERGLGEILLTLSLQAHFLPYHNHGHHRFVATPNDPATARKNEPVYFFWFRSQIGSYFSAWKIEWNRLKVRNKNPLGFENRMIRYTFAEALIIGSIYFYLGLSVLVPYLVACLIGALLLETVNYIEHYGLLRKKVGDNKYERVTPMHSWNSDHILGRLMLFELSRHSDHHANPSKPYQVLESFKDSPQMPTGYPGMMLLSLVPPLWFKVMNSKLDS